MDFAQKILSIDPKSEFGFGSLIRSMIGLNKFSEVNEVVDALSSASTIVRCCLVESPRFCMSLFANSNLALNRFISCSCFLSTRDGTLMATVTDSYSSAYGALRVIQPCLIPCFLHWAIGEHEECLLQGLMKLNAVFFVMLSVV